MSVQPVRILLVDSHESVRRSFAVMIDAFDEFELIGTAATGQEGLTQCTELHPNVVITGLNFPDMDGLTLIHHITHNFPDVKVIVLSTSGHPADIQATFDVGACQYLIKDSSSIEDIAEAVRAAVS